MKASDVRWERQAATHQRDMRDFSAITSGSHDSFPAHGMHAREPMNGSR